MLKVTVFRKMSKSGYFYTKYLDFKNYCMEYVIIMSFTPK